MYRRSATEHLLPERATTRLVIAQLLRRRGKGLDVPCIEAGIEAATMLHAPQHQDRARQQHGGDSHLCAYERGAQSRAPAIRGGSSRPEAARRPAACNMECRAHTKGERRDER